ncbi:hypothetical protein PISMIDRAFT_685918, partial [Pisolithus microcarpus 441]
MSEVFMTRRAACYCPSSPQPPASTSPRPYSVHVMHSGTLVASIAMSSGSLTMDVNPASKASGEHSCCDFLAFQCKRNELVNQSETIFFREGLQSRVQILPRVLSL